ncbi:MAG TPA: TRAP transporter small permease [Candidatus Avidesulfovibrio excrementigallinarum]|nr:TRAP transporter small permease [Candidatus Avidesulfovibrio excrementigallinarum]
MKYLVIVNKIISAFAAVALAVMTVLVLLQVLYRYVLQLPFPETQELAVYAMVFVVMLGSTIAVRRKTHVAVSLIVDKLPPRIAPAVRCIAYITMIVFFFLLLTEGWTLMLRSMRQNSPTTGIPVGYIVASIPFSSFICILYILEHLLTEIKALKNVNTN